MSDTSAGVCLEEPITAGRFAKVAKIWTIIDRLRGESGCPWDRKQTPESVQTYLVEEAHEAAAVVRAGQVSEAGEELGDLLFMVLFLIHLYEEQGGFSLEDVCATITEKMIRRHPHVFGDTAVDSEQEVRANWEKIKAKESAFKGKNHDLSAVPETLPALMRAYRILSRLAQRQPDWNDEPVQQHRLAAQLEEIWQMPPGQSDKELLFGNALLSLTNLARCGGLRAEDCLQQALDELLKNHG